MKTAENNMTDNFTKDYAAIGKDNKNSAISRQLIAADPKISAWVEASAGTGKTKVLSDRVLRLLLNGVDPARILCLTYTKAAAVEMKTRISERLSEWSVQSDYKLNKNLHELLGENFQDNKKFAEYISKARILFAELLDTPGGVKIQTIHAFCEEILKRFPLEAGVSPYFEILSEREKHEALEQIKNNILRRGECSDNPESTAVQYLTANLNEYSFPKVMENITEMHDKIVEALDNYKGLDKLLYALRKKLGISENDSEETVKAECMQKINKNALQADIAALKTGCKTSKETAAELEQVLINGCIPEDYDTYAQCFFTQEETIKKDKVLACANAAKYDPDLLSRRRKEAERLQQVKNKCRKIRVYNSSKAFLTIAQGINLEYEEYKRERSCLDFNDLINKVKALLSDPDQAAWVLYKLDGGIDHILLDEAQDTSPQQWKIVASLSEEFFCAPGTETDIRTVFAVGDRKQSIFSFQGADPRELDKMYAYFRDKAGANFEEVKMAYSFRSSQAILDSVNAIFEDKNVSRGVATAGSWVEHAAVRVGEYGRVEIWPLMVAPKNDPASLEDKLRPPTKREKKVSVRTQMATKIAQKIKQMVEESKGSSRPYRYKDFMVLVRHRNAFVEDFIRTCKNENINISGADKMVLSEQIVVQDMISLGKFLLLPQDDLSLAEVLKSPLFGLTDADLEVLCCERGKDSLWKSLCANKKYKEVSESLKILLGKLDFIRPFELFNYILVNMDGRRKFMKRMGVEAEDALDEFMNITLSYEQTQTPSLQGFISWFENDETAIKREGENAEDDAVRLMTVHHSKGLQARVVFLPDCVQIPKNCCEQKLLFGNDGLVYYPLRKDDYDDVCIKINEENGVISMEEYRRLLYVALTRAEDVLFVCGYKNDDKIKDDSWYKICEKGMSKYKTQSNEDIVYETPEMVDVKIKKKYFVPPLIVEPESWLETVPAEESPLAKPYTPSKLAEDEEEPDSVSPLADRINYYRRGLLIHKILQFLPPDNSDKARIIDEYMNKNAADLSDSDKEQIKNEILNLVTKKEYAPIFGADSRAEVPVFGEDGGKIISAQIDRLVVQNDKVIIVDFKTNRPAKKTLEETPDTYKRQLNTYKSLIGKIYPDRSVETYILWTNEARLMRVS